MLLLFIKGISYDKPPNINPIISLQNDIVNVLKILFCFFNSN